MTKRDTVRAEMNSRFTTLPEWLQSPFLPFQEIVILLLDGGNDDLARRGVAALYPPIDWTPQQIGDFDLAKSEILGGIDSLIADTEASNPLNSPAALAMFAAAAERRKA